MGRIQPLPDCYILTLIDLVTRYPKVVLLNGPNSEKVMEALICISCITYVLKEMLTIKINNWSKNGWQKQINFYTASWRLQSERTGRCVTVSSNISTGRLNRYYAADVQTGPRHFFSYTVEADIFLEDIIFVGSIFQRNLIQDEFFI